MSLALFAPLVDCHYHCCCCFYCWRLAVSWSCLLTVRRIQRINGRLLAVCHLANNGSADQQWQPAEWQRRFSKNYTHPACTTARTKSSRGPVWPRFEHFRHSSADLEKSFHMYARKLCNKPVVVGHLSWSCRRRRRCDACRHQKHDQRPREQAACCARLVT